MKFLRYLGRHLYLQVLIFVVAGCVFGRLWPGVGAQLEPIARAFIKLVMMLIGPIIFCTIVLGIGGMTQLKRVGWVGLKALVYFEVVTTAALAIGLVVVNWLKPGAGFHFHSTDASSLGAFAGKMPSVPEYLLNVIPTTFGSAFTSGEILQVLLVSILFGIALAGIGEKAQPVTRFIEVFFDVVMRILSMIVRAAPIAAFAAMAFTVGKFGLGSLESQLKLMGCVYLTMAIFITFVLGGILRANGIGLGRFLRYILDEILLVLSTSSSETGLPGLMAKLENLGCSKPVVGLVVPAGYSFNLDGTCIYLTMAAVFVAQATDTPAFGLGHQIALLAVLLLTSKGAAGLTGSGFAVLLATLSTFHTIPVSGLILILGIDRFMSEARAVTNFIGNGVAVVTVAAWEGELDRDRAKRVLSGGP